MHTSSDFEIVIILRIKLSIVLVIVCWELLMKKRTFVIKSKYGIHLRPANRIYDVIKKYRSQVEIKKGDSAAVDGRSLLGIIALNVLPGETIEVIVNGPDEDKLMEELVDLIENKNLCDDNDD